jgi:hypothetical protein
MDFSNAAVASYPKSIIRMPGTSNGRKSLGQKAPVAELVQVEGISIKAMNENDTTRKL